MKVVAAIVAHHLWSIGIVAAVAAALVRICFQFMQQTNEFFVQIKFIALDSQTILLI